MLIKASNKRMLTSTGSVYHMKRWEPVSDMAVGISIYVRRHWTRSATALVLRQAREQLLYESRILRAAPDNPSR